MIFACNAILPTFSFILLGAWLKKRGILTEGFIQQGNVLCFRILFPIMVFFNLYDAEKIDTIYLKLIIFAMGIIGISLFVLLGIVPRIVKNPKQSGVMIQSIYRGNYMLYGIPISGALGGTASVALATSIMAATYPVLNIIGVFVYSFFSERKNKPNLKKTAIDAIKNPIIWGGILGMTFCALNISIPGFLYIAGIEISGIATPMTFLLLGGNLKVNSAVKNWKLLVSGIIAKLVVLPCIVLWAAIFVLDITGSDLIPIFVFAAGPSAITNYQMAVQFNADIDLAGDFLIYSMLFSILTMFVFIYFLRSGGLI